MLTQFIKRSAHDAMGEYLDNLDIGDADDFCDNDTMRMVRFGRRIVAHNGYTHGPEYTRYNTVEDAEKAFDDERFPSTGDSVIYESYDRPKERRYEIHFSDGYADKYNDIRHAATREEAERILAAMHEEHGEFQQDWFVSDYGIHEAIEV